MSETTPRGRHWSVCRCICHGPPGEPVRAIHCVPCCAPCPYCAENITGDMDQHIQGMHPTVKPPEQANPNQPEEDRLIRLLAAANRHRERAVQNADYQRGCRFRDLASLIEGRIALLHYLDSL